MRLSNLSRALSDFTEMKFQVFGEQFHCCGLVWLDNSVNVRGKPCRFSGNMEGPNAYPLNRFQLVPWIGAWQARCSRCFSIRSTSNYSHWSNEGYHSVMNPGWSMCGILREWVFLVDYFARSIYSSDKKSFAKLKEGRCRRVSDIIGMTNHAFIMLRSVTNEQRKV